MGRPINENLPSRRPGEPRPEEKKEEVNAVATPIADEAVFAGATCPDCNEYYNKNVGHICLVKKDISSPVETRVIDSPVKTKEEAPSFMSRKSQKKSRR
jgi:hypothetical protein